MRVPEGGIEINSSFKCARCWQYKVDKPGVAINGKPLKIPKAKSFGEPTSGTDDGKSNAAKSKEHAQNPFQRIFGSSSIPAK